MNKYVMEQILECFLNKNEEVTLVLIDGSKHVVIIDNIVFYDDYIVIGAEGYSSYIPYESVIKINKPWYAVGEGL